MKQDAVPETAWQRILLKQIYPFHNRMSRGTVQHSPIAINNPARSSPDFPLDEVIVMSENAANPRRKQLFEMPVFAALIGAAVGGVIAFATGWFVTQTQLQHTDHQNLVVARRVAYEAFVGDMKDLSLTTADLQSAVSSDPQGSDAINASATMSAEATRLVTEYIDVQIDGSMAARSLANRDFTTIHEALTNLTQNQADPAAYRRAENAMDQSIKGFITLARQELGTNTS
jgi:hypothetical protein